MYRTKKQKKECEALIPVTRIKINQEACKMKDIHYVRCRKKYLFTKHERN